MVFFCINIPIYSLFVEEHVACFQSCCKHSGTYILMYTYMSFSRTYVIVKVLSYKLCTSSTVVGNATRFSKQLNQFIPLPTPEVQETSHYYTSLAYLVDVECYLFVVLI